MNGIHDLGGMHGMGPINPEQNEPVFHEPWEKRMFALFFGAFAAGQFKVDQFRHGIEKMDPAEYLESSYYEHWMHTIESRLIENGVLTKAEIDARTTELAREAS